MAVTPLDSQAPRASGSIPLCTESALCAHVRTFHLNEKHGTVEQGELEGSIDMSPSRSGMASQTPRILSRIWPDFWHPGARWTQEHRLWSQVLLPFLSCMSLDK